jgi:hypothetical protein
MDSLIIEQAQDMIKRLDDTLQNGTFDRQTGKDIDMAKVQIHELIGWLKLVEAERDDFAERNARNANMVNLLRSELKSIGYDDMLAVTRFD